MAADELMADGTDLGIEGLTAWRLLGAGGFAQVYSAREEAFDRRVAVKVLHPVDPDAARRFRRELAIMGRLSNHPNVVTPHRTGISDRGSLYLVMELATAGSLADIVNRRGPLPPSEAVDAILPIGRALGHAHRAGVLHKDVKPENILVTDDGVKLADFGISSLRPATTNQLAFTVAHCPPEAFESGRDLRDERSDLYSLASTLYVLLAGRAPFAVDPPDTHAAYLTRIAAAPVPDITQQAIPAPLMDFLRGALAKDPDDRPQTATDFGDHLEAAVDRSRRLESDDRMTSTTVDLPPSTDPRPPPPGRWSRRGVLGRAAVGLVAVVAIAGIGRGLLSGPGGDQDGEAGATTTIVPSNPGAGNGPSAAGPDESPGRQLIFNDHDSAVRVVTVLPDGRLVSSTANGPLRLWNPDDIEPATLVELDYDGDRSTILALAAVPPSRVVAGFGDGRVRSWDTLRPEQAPVEVVEHDDRVRAILPFDDGVLTAGDDGTLRWTTFEPVTTRMVVSAGEDAEIYALAETGDGRVLSLGSSGSSQGMELRVWDIARPDGGDVIFVDDSPLPDEGRSIRYGVGVLPDGHAVMTAIDGSLAVVDIATGSLVQVVRFPDQTGILNAVTVLPDGRVAAGDNSGEVRIWTPGSPPAEAAVYREHTLPNLDLVALADGRVASASEDGTVRVWPPPE